MQFIFGILGIHGHPHVISCKNWPSTCQGTGLTETWHVTVVLEGQLRLGRFFSASHRGERSCLLPWHMPLGFWEPCGPRSLCCIEKHSRQEISWKYKSMPTCFVGSWDVANCEVYSEELYLHSNLCRHQSAFKWH